MNYIYEMCNKTSETDARDTVEDGELMGRKGRFKDSLESTSLSSDLRRKSKILWVITEFQDEVLPAWQCFSLTLSSPDLAQHLLRFQYRNFQDLYCTYPFSSHMVDGGRNLAMNEFRVI
ncbi:hypothetical protein EAF00_002053 [Botryotinia globosa]|nr:hypothetical protein EAF00_002053 [Botryotinia globosa]